MKSPFRILFAAGASAFLVGCAADNATSPVASSAASAALLSVPLSFGAMNSSFVGGSAPADGFVPATGTTQNSGNHEGEDGPGWGGLMGGGIGEEFIGGLGFGQGIGRGPFMDFDDSDECTFSATTMRLECPTITHDGLTITRSFSFLDAAGVVEQAFDPAKTNTVDIKRSVKGTVTHHETEKSTVSGSSDLTVAGLAPGSTKRTVNGTSAGTDTTTGSFAGIALTAARTAGDTTTGLVIPIQDGKPTFPIAGTIVRAMKASVSLNGQTPSTSTRHEVITFDGTATAKVVITQDGVTKNCTKPLPHGKLTCV